MYKKTYFKLASAYKAKTIANYKNKLNIQAKLLNKIKSALPASLSSHALFCLGSERKIILYTDSAIWSSQLRFHQQAIIQAALTANLGAFNNLQIKVIPKALEQYSHHKETKLPSAKNIDLILSQAENQTNEPLKKALLKLGKTFQKKSREHRYSKKKL